MDLNIGDKPAIHIRLRNWIITMLAGRSPVMINCGVVGSVVIFTDCGLFVNTDHVGTPEALRDLADHPNRPAIFYRPVDA